MAHLGRQELDRRSHPGVQEVRQGRQRILGAERVSVHSNQLWREVDTERTGRNNETGRRQSRWQTELYR